VNYARGGGATVAQQQFVNLPNAITAARIVISPLIALLPLLPSPLWRGLGFALYVASAVSDYFDGWFARTRGMVTDLGKALDPLADKLLLFATFIPLIILQGRATDPAASFFASTLRISAASAFQFPFVTWFGTFSLPWWVVAVVLGREVFMTLFRGLAQGKGVVIAANYPAKVKTVTQYFWVGTAYFWFCAETLAGRDGWAGKPVGDVLRPLIGAIGAVAMFAAVGLTIASFAIYIRRYGALFTR
jgi:CDP-diacylglycerol---glycerol-3-phosphate 3-phosphatidyltransferase